MKLFKPVSMILFCALVLALLPLANSSDQPMSAGEARKILSKSAWSQPVSWTRVEGGDDHYRVTKAEWSPKITVSVQLFSAHPVRQAHAVVQAKGDPKLIRKWEPFYTDSFDDEIVVSWCVSCSNPGSNELNQLMETIYAWTTPELKQTTFLTTNSGRRVPLKNYIPPTSDGTGAKFIFPRHMADGTPLVNPEDKTISFVTSPIMIQSNMPSGYIMQNCQGRASASGTLSHINTTRREEKGTFDVRATFKLDKLNYRGKIDY